MGMGYTHAWRSKVLMKALVGYQRILHNVREGKVRRNRKGADTRMKRRFNKLSGKTEWYKVKKERQTQQSCKSLRGPR